MTSKIILPERFLEIDNLLRPQHHHLDDQDRCFYVREYTAGEKFNYSATNQLISNLKKSPEKKGTGEWRYKEQAIVCVANLFRSLIKEDAQLTFVPVPPSKAKNDPLYDDRMLQVLRLVCEDRASDVREFVTQRQSMTAMHTSNQNRRPQDLLELYEFNLDLITPRPSCLVIVDDVLTTGCHFKAMQILLQQNLLGIPIFGLFIARRVPKEIDWSWALNNS